jgi:Rubisco Assembly chaperone C-terminal domain/Rubisco accumulation factor 1 alpha helical domain/Rubisco accumulation factor 1 helix turn helix domain
MTDVMPDATPNSNPSSTPNSIPNSIPNSAPSATPPIVSTPSTEELEQLLVYLRRKMGTWVEWAEACQTLQKAGYTDQQIFEATGFEGIQQNQIMVAVQVYKSIVAVGVKSETAEHFHRKASDVLYEFRTLSPAERAAAADFAFDRKMDMDEAKEIGKSMKDFSRISQPAAEFSSHPGDIMAYFAWRTAKQKTDFQSRSMLIARGLKYVQTDTARKQVEALLLDFTNTPTLEKVAPRMPVYRIETDEDLPCVLPVIGEMPLTKADLQAVPLCDAEEPFGVIRFSGTGAYVAVPGYQVIRNSSDPIAFLVKSDDLPTRLPGSSEQVLVVIDRSERAWKEDTYFIVGNESDQLEIQWFETEPTMQILGRVILVMRPKKVLDEAHTQELWQFEE